MPKITVVVPVYKVERYLSRCVDSILAQSFKDFELILVDDGSPDNCPKICEDYVASDSRITVIHRTNGGLSAARNSGIEWALENSDSEWITFIDSDDWIHKDYLEILYNTALSNDVCVVIGTFIRTDGQENLNITSDFEVKKYDTEEYWLKNQTNATIAVGKLYKKEDFRELRYPEGKLHEDQFTTYKILFRYKETAVVENPVYYYFYNPESITKSAWSPRRLDVLEALSDQMEYFKDKGFHGAYKWAVWCYLDAICEHMRAVRDIGQYGEYVKILRKQLKTGIKKYKKELSLSYKTSFRFYKYAYPIFAKVYSKIKSL